MVRAVIFTAALALLGVAGARAQIDLTPKDTFYEVEGIRIPNVSFRNGSKTVAYTPPGTWVLTGGGKKLTLTPLDTIQAGATIETRPALESSPPATPEMIKLYTDVAVGLVPRE